MDVVLALEVRHPGRHLGRHVDQLGQLHGPALALEVLQQTPVLHQLGDDEDRLLQGTHGVQLDQFGMSQLFHDLSFGEEILGIHSAYYTVHITISWNQ